MSIRNKELVRSLGIAHGKAGVLIIPAVTLACFLSVLSVQKWNAQSRLLHVLDAVDVQQEFQGLTLDQTGIGTVLLAIQDRDSAIRSERLTVRSRIPGRAQTFDQSFSNGPDFVRLPGFTRISLESERIQAEMFVEYRWLWIVGCLGFSIVCSFFLLASLSIAAILRRQRSELERSRLIEEVSAQVSHDIRSPLAALEVVLREAERLPPEYRVLAGKALARINEISSDLLNISRPSSSGSMAEAGEVIDLEMTARSIVEEKLALLHGRSGVRLEFRNHLKAVPARIHGEAKEFQRVLSNLLNNSIEAVGNRGWVQVELSSPPGSLVVEITDSGPGIPEAVLKRLGERGNTLGKDTGSGLGLAHAVSTTRKYGGIFRVVVPPQGGTLIRMEFPERASLVSAQFRSIGVAMSQRIRHLGIRFSG